MPYPLRLLGAAGILLAIDASRHDLPVWIGAVGGLLCLALLAGTARIFLGR